MKDSLFYFVYGPVVFWIGHYFGRNSRTPLMAARILKELHRMSQQIDDLQAAVAAESTVIDSAEALLQGLHDALEAAINTGDLAAVQAVSDSIKAKTAELAAAVEANAPPAPAP